MCCNLLLCVLLASCVQFETCAWWMTYSAEFYNAFSATDPGICTAAPHDFLHVSASILAYSIGDDGQWNLKD